MKTTEQQEIKNETDETQNEATKEIANNISEEMNNESQQNDTQDTHRKESKNETHNETNETHIETHNEMQHNETKNETQHNETKNETQQHNETKNETQHNEIKNETQYNETLNGIDHEMNTVNDGLGSSMLETAKSDDEFLKDEDAVFRESTEAGVCTIDKMDVKHSQMVEVMSSPEKHLCEDNGSHLTWEIDFDDAGSKKSTKRKSGKSLLKICSDTFI